MNSIPSRHWRAAFARHTPSRFVRRLKIPAMLDVADVGHVLAEAIGVRPDLIPREVRLFGPGVDARFTAGEMPPLVAYLVPSNSAEALAAPLQAAVLAIEAPELALPTYLSSSAFDQGDGCASLSLWMTVETPRGLLNLLADYGPPVLSAAWTRAETLDGPTLWRVGADAHLAAIGGREAAIKRAKAALAGPLAVH